MVRIQKCQAHTRIGVMKISGQKGFKKPRTIGEVFELDLDDPIQGAAYKHLIANGALKPIGEAVRKKVVAPERDATVTEPPPAPAVDESGEAELVESFPPPVTETPAEPESEAVEPIPEPEQPTEPEPIGPDTKLTYIFNSHRLEIDFLTEEQIDTLRRIGIRTVADISTRTDKQLHSVQGIGKGKIGKLRELYDRYAEPGADDG